LTTDGGSIHQGGYTYNMRLEGGLAWSRWRLSLGYTRQLYEILVPGGRRFTAGADSSATASLPINKTDFFGTFPGFGVDVLNETVVPFSGHGFSGSMGALAGEFSITVAPTAHLDYRGEGKFLPQGYVNRFDGNTGSRCIGWNGCRTPGKKAIGDWGFGTPGFLAGGPMAMKRFPDVTTGTITRAIY
jgi:hypothetical protein